MPHLNELLDRLLTGRSMDEETAAGLARELASGEVEPVLAGALLAALRAKGETPEEIRGLARGMRGLALDPGIPGDLGAVDVVGTGGDGSGSLNLSTGAALLAADVKLAETFGLGGDLAFVLNNREAAYIEGPRAFRELVERLIQDRSRGE